MSPGNAAQILLSRRIVLKVFGVFGSASMNLIFLGVTTVLPAVMVAVAPALMLVPKTSRKKAPFAWRPRLQPLTIGTSIVGHPGVPGVQGGHPGVPGGQTSGALHVNVMITPCSLPSVQPGGAPATGTVTLRL